MNEKGGRQAGRRVAKSRAGVPPSPLPLHRLSSFLLMSVHGHVQKTRELRMEGCLGRLIKTICLSDNLKRAICAQHWPPEVGRQRQTDRERPMPDRLRSPGQFILSASVVLAPPADSSFSLSSPSPPSSLSSLVQ